MSATIIIDVVVRNLGRQRIDRMPEDTFVIYDDEVLQLKAAEFSPHFDRDVQQTVKVTWVQHVEDGGTIESVEIVPRTRMYSVVKPYSRRILK